MKQERRRFQQPIPMSKVLSRSGLERNLLNILLSQGSSSEEGLLFPTFNAGIPDLERFALVVVLATLTRTCRHAAQRLQALETGI
jgi:hypothetical protein